MMARNRATIAMMVPGLIAAAIYAALAMTDAFWRIWIAP